MDGWCIRDLTQIIQGRLTLGSMPPLGGELEPIGQVVADIQSVVPGCVYWELSRRGRPFAEEALSRGAQGVVVSGRHVEPWAGRFSVAVDDPLGALSRFAQDARRRFQGTVIGVAGTGCRTATLRMIKAIIGDSRVAIPVGSPGTVTTAPDQLLEWLHVDAEKDFVVSELTGESLSEICRQSDLCDPRIVVINSLANSRSASGMRSSLTASSFDDFLATLPRDGRVVLNGDDGQLRRVVGRTSNQVLWVGRNPDADLVASHVAWSDGQLSFTVENTRVQVPVWGRHYLSAALAAFAVGRLLDLPAVEIALALSEMRDTPERAEVIRTGGFAVVRDSAPGESRAPWDALRLLRDLEVPGRRVVAYADDGTDDVGYYRRLGTSAVAECGADLLIVSGPQAPLVIAAARAAGMPCERAVACESYDELGQVVSGVIESGDAVLVQGGPGPAMRSVIDRLQINRRRLAA